MKKQFIFLTLAVFLILSVGVVSACGYHDHKDCKTTETIVEGRVYLANDTKESVGNADVTITCNHDGTVYTKTTDSINSGGALKGTYFVLFPQTQCIAGDNVTVSASKDGKVGVDDGTVKNYIEYTLKRCLVDIDLAIVNVPINIFTVPEFGPVAGIVAVLGAVGIFFFVRRK